jgi:hypothetical protein
MSVVPYTGLENGRAWVELMAPAVELAKAVANTEFVPKGMRGNPAAITAAILYGDEVGLGPMQALAKIAVIEGKPTLSAEAQRALILAAGHELWIEDATATRCTVAGRRRESEQTSRVTWTMDDARRANLAGRPSWRSYPRQMLLARASAELARAVFADAIGGLAATEELEEAEAHSPLPSGNEISAEPGGGQTARRRRRPPAAAVSAPPAEPSEPEPPPEAPATMTEQQRRKLHALFRERGIEDRSERLAYCSRVVQREVPSSTDLTLEEASLIIDALEELPPLPSEGP